MDDPALTRMLDANLNRAREALRVIEDYARFARDDRATTERVKALRHDLHAIAEALGPNSLLAARDIVGDVGRDTKTNSEMTRASLEDLTRAAFARFGEAMRVLGECCKLVAASPAALAESLRYRGYELEQQILLRGELCQRFRAARLYVLLTAALCRHDWLATADALIRGGANGLQLREKGFPDAELLRRARTLRELTTRAGVLLLLNDRPDIARLAGADGVHIGQDDLSVREVRQIVGGHLLVGKSTHTFEQFEAALAEEPDYIAVGPMFPSTTKPQEHVAGTETLAQAATRTPIPLVGVGGITAENAPRVRDAGASCVCVCSAIIGAEDVAAATRSLAAAAGCEQRG